ncbi:uncharacterized protein UV8b_02741 [Ustilaginoidea virens]|uniref:Uncharacterized protein n=1 Tax=Ustilaginoidea virens TaxID=1159556 RepID=A0A063BXV6_USTVR|nr:uncharacterized protein UV8b_02741 [Ustilaginoidea virens]QUC18500.1 hypothetical protein UV8b_02741 [Ustilaginoidea virens]GAO17155.1 hypothetical protein UVI_02030970 [Ustilaginoidea virens]
MDVVVVMDVVMATYHKLAGALRRDNRRESLKSTDLNIFKTMAGQWDWARRPCLSDLTGWGQAAWGRRHGAGGMGPATLDRRQPPPVSCVPAPAETSWCHLQ